MRRYFGFLFMVGLLLVLIAPVAAQEVIHAGASRFASRRTKLCSPRAALGRHNDI